MKKLIIYLAALTIAMVSVHTVAFADDTALKRVEALAAFGIITDDVQDIEIDAEFTREDAAIWIYNTLEKNEEYEKSYFIDVTMGNTGADAIMTMKDMGIISGYSDGKYCPNETIRYADFLSMLIKVLNYDIPAELYGGYSIGYMKLAQHLDMDDNIGVVPDKLTVGIAAKILYNTLMVETPYSEKTLLEIYKDIYIREGRVTADYKTSLTSPQGVAEGRLKIGEDFYISEFNGEAWLGKYVKIFYKDIDGEEVLVHLEEDKTCEEITINGEDIEPSSSSRTQLAYYTENESIRKIKISPVADIIFNGRAYPYITEKELFVKDGKIRALDSDNNGEYDVLFVESYEVMIVRNVTVNKKLVYNKLDKGDFLADIQIKDGEYAEFYDSYGEELTFDDIAIGQVLFVAKSKTGTDNFYRIIISDNIKTEKLEQYGDEFVVAGGVRYELSDTVDKATELKLIPKLQTGLTYDFYIDPYGRVVAYETEHIGKQYGYLKNAYTDVGTEIPYMRVFSTDGTWATYEIKDKVKYNGNSYLGKILVDMIDKYIMIRYETDGQGRIKSVETAKEVSESDADIYAKIEADVFRKSKVDNMKYFSMNSSFSSQYFPGTNFKTLYVPTGNGVSEMDFAVKDGINLVSEQRYTGYLYDIDEFMFSDLFVIEQNADDDELIFGDRDNCLMVTDTYLRSIEDETVSCVEGYLNGEKWSYTSTESGTFEELKKGDIIRTVYDNFGKLKKFVSVHKYGEEDKTSQFTFDAINNGVYVYGVAKNIDYDRNLIRIDQSPELSARINLSYVTIYDPSLDEVSIGTLSDVVTGDYVVFRMRTSAVYEMFVIKQ